MKEDYGQVVRKKSLWLSWERHRRSQSLAAKLGTSLFEFQSNAPRFLKHPVFTLRTLVLLATERPRLLFVQNPSIVLTLLTIFLKPLFRYSLVVDAHNAGVYPFEKGHGKYSFLFPFLHRYADLTIVTNRVLADIVEGHGGRSAILPDPLPDFQFSMSKQAKVGSEFIVTYICSYAIDEPYTEVFRAGALLPDNVKIYVTGDDKKLSLTKRELARDNGIILTGFLAEEDYLKQLYASDCIMILTEFEDCMVCGAYEAISIGVPPILSASPVLKDWFGDVAFFTENIAFEIANTILDGRKESQDINFLECFSSGRKELKKRWEVKFAALEKKLEFIPRTVSSL